MIIKMKRKVTKTMPDTKMKVKKVRMDMVKAAMIKMDSMVVNKGNIIVSTYSQGKYSFGKPLLWLYVIIYL